jgi:hypothetical protein
MVAVISWKKLHTPIDRHIVTCFDQPGKFKVNIVIEEHIFPATAQHKPESEVPDKRGHQIQKTLHKMDDVSEHLVENPHAYLVRQQKFLNFPHQCPYTPITCSSTEQM